MRLDPNAKNQEEATKYLRERSLQLLFDGYVPVLDTPNRLVELGHQWGCEMLYRNSEGALATIPYTFVQDRGQGYTSDYVQRKNTLVLTPPDGALQGFLDSRSVPCLTTSVHTCWPEYQLASRIFGDDPDPLLNLDRGKKNSALSMCHPARYMDYVDEGLAVLKDRGASKVVLKAFCLTILTGAFSDNGLGKIYNAANNLNQQALLLALSFRIYLEQGWRRENIIFCSPNATPHFEPELAEEMKHLFAAHMVQRYKNFLLHGPSTLQSLGMDAVHQQWLVRLGISKSDFARYFCWLQASPYPIALPEMPDF